MRKIWKKIFGSWKKKEASDESQRMVDYCGWFVLPGGEHAGK